MSGGNGRGPTGIGPMTGRGAGGKGRGASRGYLQHHNQGSAAVAESAVLHGQLDTLRRQVQSLEQQLEELGEKHK
jgi:hypothetical protein